MLKVLGTIKRSFQILHQQIPVDPNSGEASAMGSLKKTNVRHCQCFMDTLYCRKAAINDYFNGL